MRCAGCGEWDSPAIGGAHTCPPEWTCALSECIDDDEDEHVKVRAWHAPDAAEAFAESYWEGEPVSDGDELDVAVLVDGVPTHFTVTASWSVDYHARSKS